MEIDFVTYCLFFIVTIFSGFYGVIFGGAGFLNIPMMIVLLGFSVPQAVATNTFGALALTVIGGYRFYKEGKVDLRLAGFLTLFALCGSVLGISILLNIDEILLKRIMVVALFVSIILSFILSDEEEEKPLRTVTSYFFDDWKRFLIGAGIAFPLGVYQSMISAGYGTMMTYLPVIVFRKTFKEAIGTARAQGIPMVIFVSIGFAYVGLLNYFVGFLLMVGMAIGGWFGAGFALKMNPALLRIIFGIVVGISAILLLQ